MRTTIVLVSLAMLPVAAAHAAMTAEATLYLDPGQNGSFGWYQAVTVPVGTSCAVDATWSGNIGGTGWAEVMLWTTSDASENYGNRADTGNAADIAYKKDSWGMNPPTSWDPELASLSPHPSGNGGSVVSQGIVVVALKLGGFSPPEILIFDDITLTNANLINGDWQTGDETGWSRWAAPWGASNYFVSPEPASLLILLAALPLLRRSRR